MFKDKKFRIPRIWSNKILAEISSLFDGDIINVSGWKDQDKQGNFYKDYFPNATSYSISNFISEARGFQGNMENEFYLDLEKPLDKSLKQKYDVVFNHTVLEHVYEVQKAFQNLCLMSKDIVIVVVPFLQEQHAEYGDYWRFTPLTLKKLFEQNSKELIYINYNDVPKQSIYILAIGSSKKNKWESIINKKNNQLHNQKHIGINHIRNSILTTLLFKLRLMK